MTLGSYTCDLLAGTDRREIMMSAEAEVSRPDPGLIQGSSSGEREISVGFAKGKAYANQRSVEAN